MGLDVIKYVLISDPAMIKEAYAKYVETEGYGYFDLEDGTSIYAMSKYEMGTMYYKNNKRVVEVFEKFKDHISNRTLKNYFNLDKLTELYGERKDFGVYDRLGIDVNKFNITPDMRGDIDEDDPDDIDKDIFAIWTNVDGQEFIMKQSDIETHDIVDEVLFFTETAYCRKTHEQSIYKSFIGDCWYEDDDSGLNESDVRVLVLPNELAELQQHFSKTSSVQNWTMSENEIIYLCA